MRPGGDHMRRWADSDSTEAMDELVD